jgi:3-oxoacyl-[acyl-carrier protein] reductase
VSPSAGRPFALVTGGSRGIGAAVAVRLASDGLDVAFCYQANHAEADRVAGQISRAGARALAHQADVADPGMMREFVARAVATLGELSVLVTCAGIIRDSLLPRMRQDQWRDVIDVNLGGTVNACQAAAGLLRERGAGSIVTLSSVAGRQGNAGQANYSASKAGVIGFTRSLARSCGSHGVRANVVCPGLIDTDMTRDLSDRARADIGQQIPLGRFGTSAEVAELVSFLASDRSSYITGQVLGIDGGITC